MSILIDISFPNPLVKRQNSNLPPVFLFVVAPNGFFQTYIFYCHLVLTIDHYRVNEYPVLLSVSQNTSVSEPLRQ